jgi:hypothetical protein
MRTIERAETLIGAGEVAGEIEPKGRLVVTDQRTLVDGGLRLLADGLEDVVSSRLALDGDAIDVT